MVVLILVGDSQFTCACAIAPLDSCTDRYATHTWPVPIGSDPWAATETGTTCSGSIASRIDRSCGARSHITSMSGCTRPRLIRTESMYCNSPS